MVQNEVSLTGIKPTGVPHIGNYFGMIKPALNLTKKYNARYFIADYHAINTIKNSEEIIELTYQAAAVWLACGLNPDEVIFYKQSAIPETFELSTILMAFTPKGLMNRAHAYKAVIAENEKKKKDIDFGVNMGLFTYPVLMAADILLFNTNYVPVGKDQIQHIEMTADIAEAVNRNYKQDLLTIPKAIVNDNTKIIIGLDGRKMSKSYNNTIPLFMPSKKLRKLIMKIVTNSQGVEEKKDPDNCGVFTLYKLFSTENEQNQLAQKYKAGGMGWGQAKQELFEKFEAEVGSMRNEYDRIIEDKTYLDEVLKKGADKARNIAATTLDRLRKAIGVN